MARIAEMAPRAGFEPATNRLTAGCSTAELPGTMAAHARCPAITKAFPLAKRQNRSVAGAPQRKCYGSFGCMDLGRPRKRRSAVERSEHCAGDVLAPEAARGELTVREAGQGLIAQRHGAGLADAGQELGPRAGEPAK